MTVTFAGYNRHGQDVKGRFVMRSPTQDLPDWLHRHHTMYGWREVSVWNGRIEVGGISRNYWTGRSMVWLAGGAS